ncbi:hypothetical protein KEM52_006217 [Ascosphaera acerosa]|nr:hypothetical protein KEM52_006217 [Ascosphaera acerosa]
MRVLLPAVRQYEALPNFSCWAWRATLGRALSSISSALSHLCATCADGNRRWKVAWAAHTTGGPNRAPLHSRRCKPSWQAIEMAGQADLDTLRGLFQDLKSLSQATLPNLERLVLTLEATLGDFRNLLDKPLKSDASRKQIASGKIKIHDTEYEVNADFQEQALQVADALNLDELHAAKLYLEEQQTSAGSSAVLAAIIHFQERRAFLLECLRLILAESFEEREDTRALMQDCVANTLGVGSGPLKNGSEYLQKCLKSMADIEHWIMLLGEQLQKAAIVGSAQDTDVVEVIEYQRHSLTRQHESLGAVVAYLFKGVFTTPRDLKTLVERMFKMSKVDACTIHYLPALVAGFMLYGSPEGPGSREDAQDLHKAIVTPDRAQRELPKLCAAIAFFWLAEYSGWPHDDGVNPAHSDASSDQIERRIKSALDDGGLDFILAVCAHARQEASLSVTRSELVALLLKNDEGDPLPEQFFISDYFSVLLMDYVGMFTQSLITNMPDAIRHLKADEDALRLEQITALREGLDSAVGRNMSEVRMHFESLLVIMAFAIEAREDAAAAVWAEPDGNMFGFLLFTSRRQTVPTASAFCELLCALAQGEDNTLATHKFLLGDDAASSKTKRPAHLCWRQIVAELQVYADRASQRPSTATVPAAPRRARDPIEMAEPESPVMLSSYLRLASHLCSQCEEVRLYLMRQLHVPITEILFKLIGAPIPSHLRTSILATLRALNSGRDTLYMDTIWKDLERFVSVTGAQLGLPSRPPALSTHTNGDETFEKLLENHDQTHALIQLLCSLVTVANGLQDAQMVITFPEDLGSPYRPPGIKPYVDFVMRKAFAGRSATLPDAEAQELQLACLNFAATCLESFNEGLVLMAKDTVDNYRTYVCLHPFTRVMEWLFSESVLNILFAITHKDVRDIEKASPSSVQVLALTRALHVMNLIFNLQSTYMDVVRPVVKSVSDKASPTVSTTSLSCFEESVLSNITLISDLCTYAGTSHPPLAIVSLSLLENLATSKKLVQVSSAIHGWRFANPLVDVINSEVDITRLAGALSQQMRIDVREIESGPAAAGHLIKTGLVHLLDRVLASTPTKPSIAHALLGFKCSGTSVDVSGGLANPDMSLMAAIVAIVQALPVSFDGTDMVSWLLRLKALSFRVVTRLCSAGLTASLIMPELRTSNFFTSLFTSQPPVTQSTLWDGLATFDGRFWETDSALALAELLEFRGLLFKYAATELRYTAQLISPTFIKELTNTALGMTTGPSGRTIQHASLFDLFDFANFDLEFDPYFESEYFLLPDFETYKQTDEDTGLPMYDLQAVSDYFDRLCLRYTENPQPDKPDMVDILIGEKAALMLTFRAMNQHSLVQHNKFTAIRAWAELVATIILICDMDPVRSAVFRLHVLQSVLPKLDASLSAAAPEALELARLAETVLESLEQAEDHEGTRQADIINEQLASLFELCIGGIPLVSEQTELRACLYSICARYLRRITGHTSSQSADAHQAIQACGPAALETISDDAYHAEDACRVSALILLDLLAVLDRTQGSSFIVDSMTRRNHIAIFVDVVRNIADEFRLAQPAGEYLHPLSAEQDNITETGNPEVPQLFVYYQTHLAFLLSVGGTRVGAERLLEAGLLQAVQDSMLFAADSDIGIGMYRVVATARYACADAHLYPHTEIQDSDALKVYHGLLASVLRVIVAVVFSRGPDTQQVREQTQHFLGTHWANVIGVCKRQAMIGPGTEDAVDAATLDELVKSYTALMAAVEYDGPEEPQPITARPTVRFS